MPEKIRWGILSTGNIARQFAEGLAVLPDAELVAVGSRSQASADAFGDQYDVPHRHASYEALAADPQVDVIYIGTPHPMHRDNSILCLDNDKAVLCEKPFTINAQEAAEVITKARDNNLFLMEAMWTRFIPVWERVRELLVQGAIGEVRMLKADFGFRAGGVDDSTLKGRLFEPELGGGALLDVGVYPVSLAFMIFGRPNQVSGMAHLGSTGVDEQAGMLLGYDAGQIAVLYTAIRTRTSHEAAIYGTEGSIHIPQWWNPTTLTVNVPGRENTVIEMPRVGNGYNYEAAEVMRCLREGKTESPQMPLSETLAIMETLDAIRGQWGLKYPMEQ